MTDLRKAAEMALEALEEAASCVQHSYLPDSMGHDWDEQIEALRQALAQEEKPWVKTYCGGKPNYCTPEVTGETVTWSKIDDPNKWEQEPLGSEWVPCVKLPVIVHVRNQRGGENHISTREGITPVLPEDLIMRGVAGEEYPIGRELFERTYTFDVDAVNMSRERVDETAKGEHEPVAWLWKNQDGHQVLTDDPDYADGTWTPLYTAPPKREWVGLTVNEARKFYEKYTNREELIYVIDKFLEEKNA